MDHSLIRLPLSENFSAQYTQLTHFTHTPAQTQHRNHSLPHSLIYTEFLPYNYNVDASPGERSTARTEAPYKATRPGGAARAAAGPNQGSCAGSYFWGRSSRRSSDYCFSNGGGGGEGGAGGANSGTRQAGLATASPTHSTAGI